MKSKTVVCFAGPRDHYEGAAALAEDGQLEQLVTDAYFYDPNWATWAPPLAARYMGPRRHPLIPGDLVTTSLKAAAFDFLGRLTVKHRQSLSDVKDAAIGLLAAEMAERSNAHLLAYSYYAGAAFSASCRPRSKMLFQLHPPVGPLKTLYAEEIEREPAARDSVQAEAEMQPYTPSREAECQAPLLAQGIICASSFTRRLLLEAGVRSSIKVVPYGVDASIYRCRQAAPRGKFTVAFIGALTQRKGALYLLRALRGLAPHVRLLIYTRAPIAQAFLAEFRGLDFEIKAGLSNARLAGDIVRADAMVLPSIAEGFGLAILEAMACGVPVICTHNTGGADLITHDRDGFVVPIRDVDALMNLLVLGLADRARFFEIGQEARKVAETHSWSRYRSGFVAAYRDLLTEANF